MTVLAAICENSCTVGDGIAVIGLSFLGAVFFWVVFHD